MRPCLIGEQCWFAENLKRELRQWRCYSLRIATVIWENTVCLVLSVYGEGPLVLRIESPDGDACDEARSLMNTVGLYNWYAVDDARGLCPSGWHVTRQMENG